MPKANLALMKEDLIRSVSKSTKVDDVNTIINKYSELDLND